MKRKIIIIAPLLFFLFLTGSNNKNADIEIEGQKVTRFPFYVLSNETPRSYYIMSGYMGDVRSVKVLKKTESKINKNSIKIIYKPDTRPDSKGWAGLYWQYPANNWGNNKRGGFSLTGAKNLFFYAHGLKGDEVLEFKVGGIQGPYGDSDQISTGLVSLSRKWTLYKIDLKNLNLKNIIGGFGIIVIAPLNQNGLTVFLNDVYYTDKEEPEPGVFLSHSDFIEIEDNIIREKKGNELLLNISEYENLIFSPDQPEIRLEGQSVLNKVVNVINEESYKRVIVMINSFDLKSRATDKELSRKRAEFMCEFFVKKGIDKRKLGYKIYDEKTLTGKSQEEVSGDAKNRNVEVRIIKWKKGEEDKYKYYFFIGYDAYIKEDYLNALANWELALKLDLENEDLKKRIEETKARIKTKYAK
ncbi:MAG: hypothetical protein PHF84_09470 [bacterium]|nr:hypothetical protein [bacterium]